MRKLIAGVALSALALGHTAAMAQTDVALERAASPVAGSEELGGGSGMWAVILAVAVGIGIIVLVEQSEDDDELPVSP
jgi:hypothetical protein